MKDGFIKAAAGTIDVVVANVQYNTSRFWRGCVRRTRRA